MHRSALVSIELRLTASEKLALLSSLLERHEILTTRAGHVPISVVLLFFLVPLLVVQVDELGCLIDRLGLALTELT